MKRILLKINIVAMLMVVLFTNISFGAFTSYSTASVEEIWQHLLEENIEFGTGYYGTPTRAFNTGEHHNNYVIVSIDKSNIPEGYVTFNEDSIKITASDGSSEVYTFAVDLESGSGQGYDLNGRVRDEIRNQYLNGTPIYTERNQKELYYIQLDNISIENAKISYTSDYGMTFTKVAKKTQSTELSSSEYMDVLDVGSDGEYDVYYDITYADGTTKRVDITDVYQKDTGVRIDNNDMKNDINQAAYRNLYTTHRYYVNIPQEVKDAKESGATVSVKTNRIGNTRQASVVSGGLMESQNSDGQNIFEVIESIVAGFIMSIAKLVNWLISIVAGRTLTLDDLIFNKFSDIRLDFFKTDVFGNNVSATSSLVRDLREPVNFIYNFFRNLVVVGYLIILVYIGIKMMLDSTTAKKKATYKDAFMAWVTGIIILFFIPYFMKYVIALDDAIVTYISDDSGIRSNESRVGAENSSQLNLDAKNKTTVGNAFIDTDIDNVLDLAEGKDYMSRVGFLAENTAKLGYAIAYLILTWQVITLLVYYYKRIFITALLIMIFPLIAFTFVWDKLNDGRSQALSAWIKEFCITVFVQAFHAIVYVFITNAIYSTITASNADFILLILASSFLFMGEDILKKMFGGGGQALGSATQSATKIAFIAGGAIGAGKRIIHNTVGKDGFVRSTARSFNDYRTYRFLAGKPRRDADGYVIPRSERRTRFEILAEEQNSISNRVSYLPNDGSEVTQNLRDADEMIGLFNNMQSGQDFAKAYKLYNKLIDARNGNGLSPMTDYEIKKFDRMMKNSSMSYAQLDRINKAMIDASAAAALINGDMYSEGNSNKVKKINQNLRIEIEAIFPAKDSDGKVLTGKNNKKADTVMQGVMTYMKENGVSSHRREIDVRREWDDTIQKTKDEYLLMKFATGGSEEDYERAINKRNSVADVIFEQYKQGREIVNERKARNFAKKVATISQMRTYEASAYDLYTALNKIDTDEDIEMANTMLKIAQIDSDIDSLKYLVAKKISSEGNIIDTRIIDSNDKETIKLAMAQARETMNWAINIASSTENNARKEAEYYSMNIVTDDLDNPYITILNIIEAAQKGIMSSSGSASRNIADVETLFEKAQISGANEDIIERKVATARAMNQKEIMKSREFAGASMRLAEVGLSDQEHDRKKEAKERLSKLKLDGYSLDDIKELRNASMQSAGTSAAEMITDLFVTPITTAAGMAIGAAVTEDFMPIEEMAIGASSGYKAGSATSNTVENLTAEKERQAKIAKLKKELNKRTKHDEQDMLKARKAFEDAAYDARNGRDGTLVFNGANANAHIEADGSLSVTVNVMAENAAFISVSENPGFPSSGWKPYQESVYYKFSDSDPSIPHTLFIYVRDRDNNIQGKRIDGIKI